LNQNQLCGIIPPEICQFSSLEFNAGENYFMDYEGNIPESWEMENYNKPLYHKNARSA